MIGVAWEIVFPAYPFLEVRHQNNNSCRRGSLINFNTFSVIDENINLKLDQWFSIVKRLSDAIIIA